MCSSRAYLLVTAVPFFYNLFCPFFFTVFVQLFPNALNN